MKAAESWICVAALAAGVVLNGLTIQNQTKQIERMNRRMDVLSDIAHAKRSCLCVEKQEEPSDAR